MRVAACLALVCGLCLAAAAPAARADDAGVLRAGERYDPEWDAVGRQFESAMSTLAREHRPQPLLAVISRWRALIVKTRRAVLGQRSSTPTGSAARAATLRALGRFEQALIALRGGVLARMRGHGATARTLTRRAELRFGQAQIAVDQAIALFRRAGLHPHVPGPGPGPAPVEVH